MQTQDTAQAPTPTNPATPQDAARDAFTAWAMADPERIARLLDSPLGQARRGGNEPPKTRKRKEVKP